MHVNYFRNVFEYINVTTGANIEIFLISSKINKGFERGKWCACFRIVSFHLVLPHSVQNDKVKGRKCYFPDLAIHE